MIADNGVIIAPVTTTDVANVLQTSSRDVGTLCIHENINPNARYKPEDYNVIANLTEDQRKENNFGWNIPSFHMNNLPGNKDDETDMWKWEYIRPKGGSTSPYRMGDFRQYNHKATSWMRDLYVGNGKGHKPVVVPREYLTQIPEKQYWAELQLDNGSEIKLSELRTPQGNIQDMYLTLVIALNRNNQGPVFDKSIFAQSEQTIGEAVSGSLGSIMASLNTARLVEDGILSKVDGFKQTICAAFLAPKMDGTDWPYGISLKKDDIIAVYYNDDYATYGDGGEGGDLPATTINITKAPAFSGGSAYGIVRLQNEGSNLCAYVGTGINITIQHDRAAYEGYLLAELTIVELGITWTTSSKTFKINVGDARTSPTQITLPMDSNKQIIGSNQNSGTYTLKIEVISTGAVKVTGNSISQESVSIIG